MSQNNTSATLLGPEPPRLQAGAKAVRKKRGNIFMHPRPRPGPAVHAAETSASPPGPYNPNPHIHGKTNKDGWLCWHCTVCDDRLDFYPDEAGISQIWDWYFKHRECRKQQG